MAWHQPADKPWPKPMMVSLLMQVMAVNWWHQGRTWTNSDFLWVRFCSTHLRAISQLVSKLCILYDNLYKNYTFRIAATSPRGQCVKSQACFMMISSDGSFFRITGPFCGEFTSHRWIPLTRASNADFDVSLMWVCISCWTNGQMTCDLRLHDVHVTSSCITEPTNSPVLWDIVIYSFISLNMYRQAGIILWMHMANERCCYNVMSSPIGWAHKKNDPRSKFIITWPVFF